MKAHELLSDKSKWTQHALYRDLHGLPCRQGDAAAFCAFGALSVAHGRFYVEYMDRINDVVNRLFPGNLLSSVNDELGYDAVMAVLREADV